MAAFSPTPSRRLRSRTDTRIIIGARYNLPNNKTKIGLEYNYGSEYWFNMAVAEDSLFAPKTSVRGDVWEIYLTHRISKGFILKLDYMKYNFTLLGFGLAHGRTQGPGLDPDPRLPLSYRRRQVPARIAGAILDSENEGGDRCWVFR